MTIEITPKEKPIIGRAGEAAKPQPEFETKRIKGKKYRKAKRLKGHTMAGNKPEIIFAAFAGLAILALKGMVDGEGRFYDDIKP